MGYSISNIVVGVFLIHIFYVDLIFELYFDEKFIEDPNKKKKFLNRVECIKSILYQYTYT